MTGQGPSPDSRRLRGVLRAHTAEVAAVLDRYGAYDAAVFGSVARGDAGPRSDIDLMVSIDAPEYEQIVSMLGLADELSELLAVTVDVVARGVATAEVSASASASEERVDPSSAAGSKDGMVDSAEDPLSVGDVFPVVSVSAGSGQR